MSRSSVSERIGVLFINSPDRFGADSHVHTDLMRGIDRARFDVHVACHRGPSDAPTEAYRLLSRIPELAIRNTNFGPSIYHSSPLDKVLLLAGLLLAFWSLMGLAIYMRRQNVRIVHSSDRPRDAVPCVVLGMLGGAKSVVHLHVKCEGWISRPVRWAFRHADALIGISEFVSGSLIEWGHDRGKVYTVLNAIDAGSWDPEINSTTAREDLNLSVFDPIILSVARILQWKGQGDLIQAIALVREKLPGVQLLIAGEDDPSMVRRQGRYSEVLRGLVFQLELERNVRFLGHRSDVGKLLAACDVFALPSFEEPFGIVFLEAMAMERPVVALENGGTPEVVENNETGLLSSPGDIQALADNLLTLLRKPELRSVMGSAGRQVVERRFTVDRMARDLENVYDRLVARNGIPASVAVTDQTHP